MNQRRLELEIYYLEKRFPKRYVFKGLDTEDTWLDCSVKSNTGKHYRLKITLDDYPAQMPMVYITNPNPLIGYDGKSLSEVGVSASLHLLSPDEEGNIQICHYKKSDWTGGNNQLLSHVMLHAKMWLEAFELYKRTGTALDYYLKH